MSLIRDDRSPSLRALAGRPEPEAARLLLPGGSADVQFQASAVVRDNAAVLETIQTLSRQIRFYDKQIEALCEERYPETEVLRQIKGVGPITALTFCLVIGDPARFANSRAVGAYLGLTRRHDDSGESEPELRITKAGDAFLRRLLVQSAHYILGRFGPDTDLRRFGQRLIERGGKSAKKRAIVAVARKLAVLLHHLWKTGVEYEPLYRSQRMAAKLRPAEHQVQVS